MRWLRRLLILTAALLTGALPSFPPDNSERRLLEQLRAVPEQFHRLCRELQSFQNLSPEHQARIRQLERDLNEETSFTQARLLRAAQRYVLWLERLTPEQRQAIEAAPSQDERLERIREIREQQWIEGLPRASRERLQRVAPAQRAELIKQYRDDDQRRRQEWQLALRHWDELSTKGPVDRLAKFPEPVQEFVRDMLLPRLGKDDRDRLFSAEGQWPLLPQSLVKLSDDYALKLLLPPKGPSRLEDLPDDVQKRFQKLKGLTKRQLFFYSGKWPDFAIYMTELAKRSGIVLPRPLGPASPADFPRPLRDFIEQKLMNPGFLDDKERRRLKAAEGDWPVYVQTLHELIAKHHLQVPGATLPGPRDYWDRYRNKTQEEETSVVSDQSLRLFALLELRPEERACLPFPFLDPSSRQRLQQEYIRRHPDEWQKLQWSDQQKKLRMKEGMP